MGLSISDILSTRAFFLSTFSRLRNLSLQVFYRILARLFASFGRATFAVTSARRVSMVISGVYSIVARLDPNVVKVNLSLDRIANFCFQVFLSRRFISFGHRLANSVLTNSSQWLSIGASLYIVLDQRRFHLSD